MATILCECGAVCLEILGTSMMSVVCDWPSCRTAGREFDARSRVAPFVDISGGTPVVLWRKDRVNCLRGCERLKAYRLTAESLSRRMVASCCETPMFGDFTEGFWISILSWPDSRRTPPVHACDDKRYAGWSSAPRR